MAKARSTRLPARVIGIGASAGGLDAIRQLIAHVPLNTGYAFVVLQHLPPSQIGELAKLLAPTTALPVIDLESGTRVVANTIFIVPPHTSVSLARGTPVFRTAKTGIRPNHPIDALFTSLAKVMKRRAVGVVLSGTGNDGSDGLRAIQQAGGLTLVQDVATAQFDDMPRNAIAAGVAELVLPPADIGQELGMLATVLTRPHLRKSDNATPAIDRVLEQLREASGIDFTSYKRTTIERRLARRIAKFDLASLEDYSAYLVEHPEEATVVYEDLLIHVTEFFRDREVLDKFIALVVAELESSKAQDAPLRVWVPGCSTGEELYSLAMLLVERCGNRTLQLFGSDLSERAIETARHGRYPATIAAQVSPERLARFFVSDDAGYRIKKEIRERCIFVQHDLVSDPPFSKLDVVSCRNVLIYLGTPLQRRVMLIFHYALQQPGFLLLGRAETIVGFEHLFATLNADARVFVRRPAARSGLTFFTPLQLGRQPWRRTSDVVRSALDIQRDVDHVLLARYAPPCVLVNDALEVVQYRGRTGPYLEQPPGQPQLNVLRMARQGIAPELTLALERAQRLDKPVRRENVIVRDPAGDVRIHLDVVPLRGTVSAKRHFLIMFEAIPQPVAARKHEKRPRREREDVEQLQQELAATKEYLHSIVTQHLATSEELSITNEELLSTNEELQSSNEELQTSK